MLLYKYFPPDTRFSFRKPSLRFTPPGLFNDPFDSLPAFSPFSEKQIIDKVNKGSLDSAFYMGLDSADEGLNRVKLSLLPEANKTIKRVYLSNPGRLDDEFANLHRARINREIGALCVTENSKSIVMWSHYASDHKGFVVGFDSEDAFFCHRMNDPEDIGVLTPLNYSEKRPYVKKEDIERGESLPDILFTKNKEWSYEREWRIIRFLRNADEITENIHLFRVPGSAIQEVIFGCKIEQSTTENLLKSINQNPNLKHVRLFNARLSKLRYEMEVAPHSIGGSKFDAHA